MKLIFLDVDGVLNCVTTTDIVRGANGIRYDGVDSDKIELLKEIIDKTDANIILSSTWRLHDEFVDHLEKRLGFKYHTRIKGHTPTAYRRRGSYSERCDEIKKWFEENEAPDNYIILDDIDYKMNEYFGDHYFQTDANIGLTKEIADKCIERLRRG